MRLLIIEDDVQIASNLQTILKGSSYASDTALNAKSGLAKIADTDYDLIILDWMLPDMDGPQVLKQLRSTGLTCPILMLTAKSQVEDIVLGLNAGADDYLTKPFEMAEFLARIRTLLRRLPPSVVNPTIRIADLEINTNTHEARRAGRAIHLSPKEYSLLEYLATHAGQSIDRISLLSHVWDENADEFSNTVDVHIRYLRSKIDDGHRLKLIHTVKGKGYLLHAPD